MFEVFLGLFESDFIVPNYAFLLLADIVSLQVIADSLSVFAYTTIFFAFIYFVGRRKDLKSKGVFVLFATFIFLGGITYAMDLWSIWQGPYEMPDIIKLVVGLASVVTAIVICRLLPRALELPSLQEHREAQEALKTMFAEKSALETRLIAVKKESDKKIQTYSRTLEEANLRTRLLISVTSRSGHTLEEQIANVLRVTVDVLGLEMGILSLIQGEKYTVMSCFSPDDSIVNGHIFELGNTYCSITTQVDDVVSISDAADSKYREHPCYQLFHLASYIGLPIHLKGQLYGTLNFTSSEAKQPAFSELDRDFVRLLGKWVQWILELREGEQDLQRYADELERSNKELDDFAYVASHDLKAPLRAISNLSTWIFDDVGDSLPEESKNNLDLLRQRTGRMEQLLDDLLEYSRAGRVQDGVEEINCQVLVQEILEMLAPPDHFTFDIADDLPVLNSEKAPIRQIFFNLLGNAIKHHDKENGHITVSWQDQESMIAFSITDDGPGIPEEFHDRVFRLFQTLKSRDEVEGSGMGLAIIQKLVRHHGGTITLKSAAGEGTTFTFTWPKAAMQVEELVVA